MQQTLIQAMAGLKDYSAKLTFSGKNDSGTITGMKMIQVPKEKEQGIKELLKPWFKKLSAVQTQRGWTMEFEAKEPIYDHRSMQGIRKFFRASELPDRFHCACDKTMKMAKAALFHGGLDYTCNDFTGLFTVKREEIRQVRKVDAPVV